MIDKLKTMLSHQEFVNSKSNSSLLIIICLIYVDDIIVTRNNLYLIADIIMKFYGTFSLKELELSYFLEVEIYRYLNSLHLS